MCEYDPGCMKRDDPKAVALWASKAIPDVSVLCPREYHLIGAAFDLPNLGLALCVPHYAVRRGSLSASLDRSRDRTHFHASLTPVSAYGMHTETGRCHCGTWWYAPKLVEESLESWPMRLAASAHPKRVLNRPYILGSYVRQADTQGK